MANGSHVSLALSLIGLFCYNVRNKASTLKPVKTKEISCCWTHIIFVEFLYMMKHSYYYTLLSGCLTFSYISFSELDKGDTISIAINKG